MRYAIEKKLVFGLLLVLGCGWTAQQCPAAVWSVDTSKLDLRGLQSLERSRAVRDFVEMGDRLLVVGDDGLAGLLHARGLAASAIDAVSDLSGTYLVLSKHSKAERFLSSRTRIVAHEGPYFLIRPSVPALNRIAQESDHQFQIVPAKHGAVVFRSPAHLASVEPADPALAQIANGIDKARYEATLKKLIDFKTRYSYGPVRVAAAWAVDTFKSFGLDAKIVDYENRGQQLPNVVAELKGTSRSQDLIVVGAHLDSIAYDSQNYAPGADDNGSGSAGVLEMARVLSTTKPQATIRFLLFSGEEQGLYGSIAYVQQLQQSGEMSRVKAMINLDMIAFDQKAPLDVMLEGKEISHGLSDRLQANAQAFAPALAIYRTDNAWGSDHISFLDANVPSTLTIEYEYDDNGREHSPRDVFEICNLDLAVAILRMDVATLAELSGAR